MVSPTRAFIAFGLLAWALTCVTRVPPDGRAVYERSGAPAGVLQPGLHAGLPWPFGTTHPVEFGTVHDLRLDTTLVVAGGQAVSTRLRVFYRTGLTDADAQRATYATVQPDALVHALAGCVAVRYFAAQAVDDVLGMNSETIAATLHARLQEALDTRQTGLQIVDVVVERLQLPAEAYRAMHDAEIAARMAVAVAHGAAAASAAQSRQSAYDMTSTAQAQAAETLSRARASLVRFDADRAAAHAGGPSFLLESYFTALGTALAHAPKTIIDHRLNWPEAPVLDLRPYSASAGATAGKEE